jgi:hypothetical protein
MLQRRKLNVLVENQGHRICPIKMDCDCPFIFYMCLYIKVAISSLCGGYGSSRETIIMPEVTNKRYCNSQFYGLRKQK